MDDISLEKDSIQLTLKDIHSKGIQIKNLNKFIKEETPITGQKKEIEISTENLKNEMSFICYDDKINLVLDINEPLVY